MCHTFDVMNKVKYNGCIMVTKIHQTKIIHGISGKFIQHIVSKEKINY